MASSHSTPASAAATARATKQLTRQVAAVLAGKKRGPDRGVRRDSYDVNDPRARVFRPIANGSPGGALGWLEDLAKCAREFDAWTRGRGGGFFSPSAHHFYAPATPKSKLPADAVPISSHGALTPYAVTVFEALCFGNKLDFATGRLDPPIAWLEAVTGFARKTVVEALARLRLHGFIDWVRRTRTTGRTGDVGPQREQETNAYFFDLSKLARRVLHRFRDLAQRRRRRAAGAASAGADRPSALAPLPSDPELRDSLRRLGEGVAERECSIQSVSPPQSQDISGRASRGAI